MTETEVENAVEIQATPSSIFSVAAAVERWPDILPHYRTVEILGRCEGGRLMVMRAYRGRIPVRWSAITWANPEEPRIHFRHTAGFTKGMEVEWRFEELPAGGDGPRTRVVISHRLAQRRPAMFWRQINSLIAHHFIDYIAGRTLERMKEVIEAERAGCAVE
ncbi:MAG TPA: SRPBCC family protein [Chloroflexota bacterium]|nr:SRPBCC family protein [Chloroflexota bacterium]